ncbi:MAG: hypothetical protein SGJ19_08910 [Planctomycetia bacterium]|nr:hypothetical protein [Planctomycetia bacterium]
MRAVWLFLLLGLASGCAIAPRPSRQPQVHNPFPQLAKVAVAPFFNSSSERSVDGRRVALAYFNELQAVPGFEVVPMGVVEAAMQQHNIQLASPSEARRLAQLLEVDAIVIGAVTDFSPYYPPRMGMQVEWYSANPCYHPIPPGYALPWGTTEEEYIPDRLVFEAEMALAKEQLKTQTPAYKPAETPTESLPLELQTEDSSNSPDGVVHASGAEEMFAADGKRVGLPETWPDPRGFAPRVPTVDCPDCDESTQPVLQHTRIYHGNDADFTTALESYYYFRNDQRAGDWRAYLERTDDFTRFCCHMHISEMLSARGGAGESRVVWRWPESR